MLQKETTAACALLRPLALRSRLPSHAWPLMRHGLARFTCRCSWCAAPSPFTHRPSLNSLAHPLPQLARREDAPAGSAALAATLIYAAGAPLFDSAAPGFEIAVAGGAAALLVAQQAAGEGWREASNGIDGDGVDGTDEIAAFDERLSRAIERREAGNRPRGSGGRGRAEG